MPDSKRRRLILAAVLLAPFSLSACGDKEKPKEAPKASAKEEDRGEADTRPLPADRPGILKALDEAVAQANKDLAANKLDDIHKSADRIEKLADALAKAGGGEGDLAKLAKDLDTQGDAGNAAGVRELILNIEGAVAAARKR